MSEVNNVQTNTSSTSSTSASKKSALSDTTATNGNSTLGKEAFLQLLVTQMKYQDPLNPQSDTEYVAQLATFSQLEQMQNLNSSFTNSQAFGLVGKEVIMTTTSASGNLGYVNGKVDFVSMINGEPFLSIDDKLYPANQLDSVVSSEYADELEKEAAKSATTTA